MLSDKQIVQYYRLKHLSCQAIAQIDGRSSTTIYLILKRKNVKLRNKSEANQFFNNNILIQLYNLGLSYQQIGKLLGLDPSTIAKRFNNINYPTRSKRTSINLRYSDEEFERYFCNQDFLEVLGELINGAS